MAHPDMPHLDALHADMAPTDAVPPALPALVALALRPLAPINRRWP